VAPDGGVTPLSDSPGISTGPRAESDVYDCLVLFLIVLFLACKQMFGKFSRLLGTHKPSDRVSGFWEIVFVSNNPENAVLRNHNISVRWTLHFVIAASEQFSLIA